MGCGVGGQTLQLAHLTLGSIVAILAHGFLRLRCGDCGHDKLVAFSCKWRGFCPVARPSKRPERSQSPTIEGPAPRVVGMGCAWGLRDRWNRPDDKGQPAEDAQERRISAALSTLN